MSHRGRIAYIYVDGLPYRGEDEFATESAEYGGEGWHVANHGSRARLLVGGGDPRPIVGAINLKSHIDRILARLRDGTIVASEVSIRFVAEEGGAS